MNTVCLQARYSCSSGRGVARSLANQLALLLSRSWPGGLVAPSAYQRPSSSAQGEVSSRVAVWFTATMGAVRLFVVVLLFGTRIQENNGKWPEMNTVDVRLLVFSCICRNLHSWFDSLPLEVLFVQEPPRSGLCLTKMA